MLFRSKILCLRANQRDGIGGLRRFRAKALHTAWPTGSCGEADLEPLCCRCLGVQKTDGKTSPGKLNSGQKKVIQERDCQHVRNTSLKKHTREPAVVEGGGAEICDFFWQLSISMSASTFAEQGTA